MSDEALSKKLYEAMLSSMATRRLALVSQVRRTLVLSGRRIGKVVVWLTFLSVEVVFAGSVSAAARKMAGPIEPVVLWGGSPTAAISLFNVSENAIVVNDPWTVERKNGSSWELVGQTVALPAYRYSEADVPKLGVHVWTNGERSPADEGTTFFDVLPGLGAEEGDGLDGGGAGAE